MVAIAFVPAYIVLFVVKEKEVVKETEVKYPKNDVRNIMGFSALQTMGFMASLATIGLAVFGIVFHFMTR